MSKLDLSAIRKINFPAHQYIREEHEKKQIVLHHTASGRGTDGDFRSWINDPKRIATCLIVDFEGVIHQCFNSKWWGYHLGIRGSTFRKRGIPYQLLDKHTIGIEIDAWGWLKKQKGEGGKWLTYTGKKLDPKRVVEHPEGYRGYRGYERYTEAQIETVKQLLEFWHERYNIPIHYNEDMWEVSDEALKGTAGVYTHNSYRPDKTDCHPDPNLIKMLKSL